MHADRRRVTWLLGVALGIAGATAVQAQSTDGGDSLLSSLGSLFTDTSTSSTSTSTTGVTSSLLSQQQSVIASNIQDEATQCATGTQPGTVGYAIKQAQNEHLALASVRPDTDALFSIDNNCFTGLSQLFDLSSAIPSLGSIMSSAEQAVEKYAKQQICQAAGQVTSLVTTPFNQAITSVNSQYGASAVNGDIGQQLSTIDPNLGSAWNTSSTTNGSYTVNANAFGINQASFDSGGSTTITTNALPTSTGTSNTSTPVQTPSKTQDTSVLGRLQNLIH